jgi:hypothetical protein
MVVIKMATNEDKSRDFVTDDIHCTFDEVHGLRIEKVKMQDLSIDPDDEKAKARRQKSIDRYIAREAIMQRRGFTSRGYPAQSHENFTPTQHRIMAFALFSVVLVLWFLFIGALGI